MLLKAIPVDYLFKRPYALSTDGNGKADDILRKVIDQESSMQRRMNRLVKMVETSLSDNHAERYSSLVEEIVKPQTPLFPEIFGIYLTPVWDTNHNGAMARMQVSGHGRTPVIGLNEVCTYGPQEFTARYHKEMTPSFGVRFR